jgi:AcrR family transcriptional regulator
VTRAAPLPLDERRAALIAVTEPLLERFGREVSTRQIAEAAGVAEGTIFRAFATKEELIDAVIADAFDNRRTCEELSQINPTLSLEERLATAVALLQERLRRVVALFGSLRLQKEKPDRDSYRARQQADNELIDRAIASLMEPDQDQLRLGVMDAASALRAITFSISHPMAGAYRLAEPRQVVDLVLHGICQYPPQHHERTSC